MQQVKTQEYEIQDVTEGEGERQLASGGEQNDFLSIEKAAEKQTVLFIDCDTTNMTPLVMKQEEKEWEPVWSRKV